MRTTPPFRADQVGSLLRPRPSCTKARARAKAGAISAAQLKEVEDRCIRAAVGRQEALGLRVVTDGELRRDFWHLDFLRRLDGVGLAPVRSGVKFHALRTCRRCRRSPARLSLCRSDHGGSSPVPEIGGEGRAQVHHPGAGDAAICAAAGARSRASTIRDLAAFWAGRRGRLSARRSGRSPPPGARICSSTTRAPPTSCVPDDPREPPGQRRRSGDAPGALTRARSTGPWLAAPPDMAVTMHTCRGNFRSTWPGLLNPDDDAVVEAMFSTDAGGRLHGAGQRARRRSSQPLRLLPRNKMVRAGYSSPPSRARSSPARRWRRRIGEAAEYRAAGPPVRCRRSAASPATAATATRSPRTSSGGSWNAWWRCLATSGANADRGVRPARPGRASSAGGRGPGARPPHLFKNSLGR